MNDITKVVDLVDAKLKALLDKYQFLVEENDILLSKIALLEQELAKEKYSKEELEEKYNALRIAKTIEGSKEDKRETKLKINALIREIDSCIGMLNE